MRLLRPASIPHAYFRSVAWRDLQPLSPGEIAKELLLPWPWLAGSWLFASAGLLVPALACSFVFFLCGLRLVHNAFHCALGIPRAATDAVLLLLSIVMLGAMHAVKYNHLQHHKHCLGDEDVEGASARMSAGRALACGPLFPLKLHLTAWRRGNPRLRRWIGAELLLNVVWVILAVAVFESPVLRYQVTAMLIGQCLTAFFAVWTVHHHCEQPRFFARTLRGRLKNLITFNMFLHVEHHLFPNVPTCHLPALSTRIDQVAPELRTHQVF